MDLVVNPVTEKPLSEERSNFVRKLRGIRKGARNAKRSGHPAKRAEATRVEAMVPGMIRTVYMQDSA